MPIISIQNLDSSFTSEEEFHLNVGTLLKQSGLTLEQRLSELQEVCQTNPAYRINTAEQNSFYEHLQTLQKNSINPEVNLFDKLPPTAIIPVVIILSRCIPSNNRNLLLSQASNRMLTEKETPGIADILTMLTNLPSFPNVEKTVDFLLTRLLFLSKNQQFTPNKIATLLHALGKLSDHHEHWINSPIIRDIYNRLAEQLAENQKNGELLTINELAYSFYSLRHTQLINIVESLLIKLLRQFQEKTQAGEWMDGRELGMLLQGIQNILNNDATTPIAHEINLHIQNHTSQKSWLLPEYISTMIACLKNQKLDVTANTQIDAVNQFLTVVAAHIRAQTKPFTLIHVAKVLPGLQNIAHLPITSKILREFTQKLKLPRMNRPTDEELFVWTKNARSHLNQYLDSSAPEAAQSAARAFLQKAVEVFKPVVAIDLEALLEDTDSDSPRTLTTGSDTSLSEEESPIKTQ